MNKATHPFMHLLLLVLLSFLMMIFSAVLTFVLTFVGVDMASNGNILAFQSVTQLLTFLLPVLIVVRRYYRDEASAFLRLDLSGSRWLLGLAGIVILLLLTPLIDQSSVWNDNWHWGGVFEPLERALRSVGEQSETLVTNLLSVSGMGALAVNLLVIALIPALCEEIFFRAGIQNLLQRWLSGRYPVAGVHIAVWVTAAIFSLGHGEVFAFLPRFILGALLGYLYVGAGSIVVNVVVHFFNNAVIVVAYWFMASGHTLFDPSQPLAAGAELIVCCSLAAVALLCVTFGKGLKTSR